MYALGAGARIVLQDTVLQSCWLLKKDSYIFMPNQATHFDTASWGSSVNTFDAQRLEHIKSGRDQIASAYSRISAAARIRAPEGILR